MREQHFAFGPFILDAARGVLMLHGNPVRIGHRALAVLTALLRAGGQVVTKEGLIRAAWPRQIVEESNLSVQIAALRKLLAAATDEAWIETVARVGYRFAGPLTSYDGDVQSHAPDEPIGPGCRASIAVLPFENLSGDAGQAYFADGVSEDIVAALARFRWLFVVARNTSFALKRKGLNAHEIAEMLGVRYALAGSVRRAPQRIRISAELLDAHSGMQLWAERYDFPDGELFAVQDQIAERVVGAIEPELLRTQSARVVRAGSAADLSAWDLVHRGTWYFHQVTKPTHLRARELFREACSVDPRLADAHAWLGRVCAGIVAYGWSTAEPDDLREGRSAAVNAVRLDEKNPYAHYALAITSTFASDFDTALRAGSRAIELSPAFALGHLVVGMARLFSGHDGAAASLERGLTLNPHDPQNFVWQSLLAVARFIDVDFQRALDAAMNALKARPDWQLAREMVVCCYQALGRTTDARALATQFTAAPSAGDALAPLRRANPQVDAKMQQLLRDAGAAIPLRASVPGDT